MSQSRFTLGDTVTSDFTVVAEQKEIAVHREVLTRTSPFLNAFLTADPSCTRINANNAKYDAMVIVLTIMYSANTPHASETLTSAFEKNRYDFSIILSAWEIAMHFQLSEVAARAAVLLVPLVSRYTSVRALRSCLKHPRDNGANQIKNAAAEHIPPLLDSDEQRSEWLTLREKYPIVEELLAKREEESMRKEREREEAERERVRVVEAALTEKEKELARIERERRELSQSVSQQQMLLISQQLQQLQQQQNQQHTQHSQQQGSIGGVGISVGGSSPSPAAPNSTIMGQHGTIIGLTNVSQTKATTANNAAQLSYATSSRGEALASSSSVSPSPPIQLPTAAQQTGTDIQKYASSVNASVSSHSPSQPTSMQQQHQYAYTYGGAGVGMGALHSSIASERQSNVATAMYNNDREEEENRRHAELIQNLDRELSALKQSFAAQQEHHQRTIALLSADVADIDGRDSEVRTLLEELRTLEEETVSAQTEIKRLEKEEADLTVAAKESEEYVRNARVYVPAAHEAVRLLNGQIDAIVRKSSSTVSESSSSARELLKKLLADLRDEKTSIAADLQEAQRLNKELSHSIAEEERKAGGLNAQLRELRNGA